LKKHVQLVKLPTRSQTRRVKLYSIESQNQVDLYCLICFSFVAAVLEKQIQKECDLRNRALPPSVSDCIDTNIDIAINIDIDKKINAGMDVDGDWSEKVLQ
jgi:hypothetical protein